MSEARSGGGAVTGDDPTIVEFPKAEITPEERARRLKADVDRLAGLPVVAWLFYLPDIAEKHGVPPAVLKKMVEATIKEREKKAHKDKVENQQRERRAEKAQSKARREQVQADNLNRRCRALQLQLRMQGPHLRARQSAGLRMVASRTAGSFAAQSCEPDFALAIKISQLHSKCGVPVDVIRHALSRYSQSRCAQHRIEGLVTEYERHR